MSGTSMDGIDASIIVSDGEKELEVIDNYYEKYDRDFKYKLRNFAKNADSLEYLEKNKINYMTLNFPWEGDKKAGDIETLKTLAEKTVFSNKISISFTDNEFELHGRSSDIISYLLQLADNGLIHEFILSIYY